MLPSLATAVHSKRVTLGHFYLDASATASRTHTTARSQRAHSSSFAHIRQMTPVHIY